MCTCVNTYNAEDTAAYTIKSTKNVKTIFFFSVAD